MSEQIAQPEIDFSKIFKPAEFKQEPIKVAISGPSGSGKTYSALLLARGLASSWEKIAVIDTEKSAAFYRKLGNYRVADFTKPYEPERFIKALELAQKAGFEVVIMDSITPEWDGEGGCLDIHAKHGGKFQDWKEVTPRHNHFIESIKSASCHVICTMRKKVEYAINSESGKTKVEKLGMKEIQREGMDYEMSVLFDVDLNHYAKAAKDRTNLFDGVTPFKINEETGKTLLKWTKGEI